MGGRKLAIESAGDTCWVIPNVHRYSLRSMKPGHVRDENVTGGEEVA